MKHIASFSSLLLVVVVQTACLKDPIPDPLNSNPFDTGYDGTPLVELSSTTTVINYDINNLPIDTVMTVNGTVREELFPTSTTYLLITSDPRNGQIVEFLEPGVFTRQLHHVQLGTTLCLDTQLEVVGTRTRVWTICAVANL